MRDFLFRFIVAAWALVVRITRGRLPFGASFVPASQQQSSQPLPPQDAQPLSDGAQQSAQGQ